MGKRIILPMLAALAIVSNAQDPTKTHAERLTPVVEKKKRDITIIEDRYQRYMISKLYELKNAKAADIMPFVLGAVQRYNSESSVESLSYEKEGKEYLLVNMGVPMIKYIDDMIAKIDRPSKKDGEGSFVDGDGIYRFVYYPKHRFFSDMISASSIVSGGDGNYFSDSTVNMFYWKDSKSDGECSLKWLQFLDKPAPQASMTFNVYAANDDDFKELGIDFVSWKNGPGAELAGFGADFFDFRSDERLFANAMSMFSGFGNAWAGMIFAPQFDASFLRILAQKGKARVCNSGVLTVKNDLTGTYRITLDSQLQNISKTELMEISVGTGSSSVFDLTVASPIICFNDAGEKASTMMFNYLIDMSDTVERNNTGTEFTSRSTLSSNITLAEGVEKILGSFTKSQDVEQHNGMDFFGEIPVVKYLFGAVSHSKSFTRFFVTVRADANSHQAGLSEWAGKIVDASKIEMVSDKEKK
jgi:hypothetical protein